MVRRVRNNRKTAKRNRGGGRKIRKFRGGLEEQSAEDARTREGGTDAPCEPAAYIHQ